MGECELRNAQVAGRIELYLMGASWCSNDEMGIFKKEKKKRKKKIQRTTDVSHKHLKYSNRVCPSSPTCCAIGRRS
jgi:hypothetical protein